MGKYNFDEIIDRRNTNAMNTDGFRDYIFHAPPTMKFPYEDDEFIRMWIADMEFATPPEIIDAVRERLDKRIFGYTKIFDNAYYEAFNGWCKKLYDWSFEKEHLVTSNGIVPALYELVDYITNVHEKILIVTPSYAYFKHAADFNKREIVTCDLIEKENYYTIDFDDFEKKAKDDRVTLCIFCNPHNPSGRVWTEEELTRVGKICLDNNVIIISDEIHCDLLRNGKKHIPMAKLFPKSDKIITCMAPTKTFNIAGFMISNIIIPNDKIRSIYQERHYITENPLSVVAAQAAYTNGYEWLCELKDYLDENFKFTKEYLAKHLPKAVMQISEATYLGWVNVGAYVEDDENLPLLFANHAGVLLEGGDMFVRNSNGFIRLNLACPRAILEEGLKRICNLLNNR